MTQPAKVQEPSMEEILASIRRIIADDEAKPPVAEKPASPAAPAKPAAPAPAAKPAAMADIPPSAIAAAPKPAPPAAKPAPPPAAPARRRRRRIQQPGRHRRSAQRPRRGDRAGGDPSALARRRCVRTHRRHGGSDGAGATAATPPQPSFRKVEPQDDLEFAEAARAAPRQPAYEPPPFESAAPVQQILSHTTVSAVESAFNSLANTVLSNNARTLEDLVKEMLRPMLKNWLDDNLPGLVERIVKAEIERVSRGGR